MIPRTRAALAGGVPLVVVSLAGQIVAYAVSGDAAIAARAVAWLSAGCFALLGVVAAGGAVTAPLSRRSWHVWPPAFAAWLAGAVALTLDTAGVAPLAPLTDGLWMAFLAGTTATLAAHCPVGLFSLRLFALDALPVTLLAAGAVLVTDGDVHGPGGQARLVLFAVAAALPLVLGLQLVAMASSARRSPTWWVLLPGCLLVAVAGASWPNRPTPPGPLHVHWSAALWTLAMLAFGASGLLRALRPAGAATFASRGSGRSEAALVPAGATLALVGLAAFGGTFPHAVAALALAAAAAVGLRTYFARRAAAVSLASLARSEAALAESEEQLRSLFQASRVGICLTGLDGRLLRANEAFHEMLGYEPGELLGRPVAELTHSDDAALTRERHRAIAAGELESYALEKRYLHQDGSAVWARANIATVHAEAGRPRALVGVIENIDEQRQAEQELLRHSAILSAVDLVADALLRTADWRDAVESVVSTLGEASGVSRAYLCLNRAASGGRILTTTAHEWLAFGVEPGPAIVDLDLAAGGYGRWADVLGAGEVVQGVVSNLPESERTALADRGSRAVLAVPVFVDGEWWGLLGFSDHVEERVWSEAEIDALRAAAGTIGAAVQRGRAEDALRETTETLEALVDASPVGIVSLDPTGRVLRWNPAAERIFGWSADEALGRFAPYVAGESRAEFLGSLERCFAGERWDSVEVRRRRKDGSPVDLSISTSPLAAADGGVSAVVAVITDVTVRKRIAEAMRRREAILGAVSLAGERLLEAGDWRDTIHDVLAGLGEAAAASRVHLFEHAADGGGRVVARQAAVWSTEGVPAAAGGFRSFAYAAAGLGPWLGQLRRGEPAHGAVRDIAEPARGVMSAQGTLSALMVPVVVGGELFGAIGFDDCSVERVWDEAETDALRVAGSTLAAAIERQGAEDALRGREAILLAVSLAAERLLGAGSWRDVADEVLRALGEATGASRAYVFENHAGPDGTVLSGLRHEWVGDGVPPTIGDPDMQSVSLRELGAGEWESALAGGEIVQRTIRDLAGPIRAVLDGQGVKSLVAAPILVDGSWWGFLGFDDCDAERERSEAELGAVHAAAETLAAAVGRERVVEALHSSEEKYRQLFDANPNPSWVFDRDTLRFVAVNEAAIAHYGYSREEFLELTLLDVRPEREREAFLARIATRTGADRGVFRHVTKDGTEILVESGVDDAVFDGRRVGLAVMNDITERERIAETLRRREAILSAVSFAAERLLGAERWDEAASEVLEVLGQAADASRVYLFEAHETEAGERLVTIRHQWAAPGVELLAGIDGRETFSPDLFDDGAWEDRLEAGEVVQAIAPEIGEPLRGVLAAQGVRSLLMAPVGVGGARWGLIGLHDCASERRWSEAEVEAIRAAAGTLGGAMKRGEIEQELRRSEEKYRQLFDANPNPAYLFDRETLRFLAVNEAAIAHYGWSREEFLSMSILDIRPPEERAALVARIAAQSGPDHTVFRHRKKDGTEISVEIGADNSITFEGRAATLIVVTDITERIRAERALAESEERSRTLIHNVPGVVYRSGPDGWTMEFVSEDVEELVGYPASDLVDDAAGFARLIHPDDRPRVGEAIAAAISERRPVELEYRMVHADGTERWVSERAQPVIGAAGDVLFLDGVIMDVSARKRAERERERLLAAEQAARTEAQDAFGRIARQQERLRKLLLAVAELTVENVEELERAICDGARDALGARYAALTVLAEDGETRERLVVSESGGRPRRPEELSPAAEGLLETPIEAGGRRWGSLYVGDKDGGFDLDDELLAEVLARYVGQAITNAELYQGSLEQNEQLRALDRMKDEFIALVSHELRTPLTSIVGYVELVRDEEAGEVNDEQRHFLAIVERNAQRLLRLVGDLLFVAQINAGKLSLERAPVDLEELARECIEAAQPRAAQKQIELALHGEVVEGFAGDRVRLGQLLDNLVSNAIKFTPEGGQVQVLLARQDGGAHLEVSDTGIGIPPEEQTQLFERFFRTKGATQKAIQGTGLGLTITKAIAEAHGGRIWVESEDGAGTTFHVQLPFEPPVAGDGGTGHKGVEEAA